MRNCLYLLACIFVLFSCHPKPVTVNIDLAREDSTTKHLIVFDGKDTVRLPDSMVNVQLTPGSHSFVLDKAPAKKFTVGEKGGLLNLSNQQYVAFEIEYREKDPQQYKINLSGTRMRTSILIDSFVVATKGVIFPPGKSDPSVILQKLFKSKNGNYIAADPDYDNSTNVVGMRQFGKDQLFIDKFWDYDMNEEIPENIEVRTNNNGIINNSTFKTTYLPSRFFLLAAQLSPEEYTVHSVADIRSGKSDKLDETISDKTDSLNEPADDEKIGKALKEAQKKNEKNKEKNQMKF